MTKAQEEQKDRLRQRVRDMLASLSENSLRNGDCVLRELGLADLQRWLLALQHSLFFDAHGQLASVGGGIALYDLKHFETVNSATDWLWIRRSTFVKGALK